MIALSERDLELVVDRGDFGDIHSSLNGFFLGPEALDAARQRDDAFVDGNEWPASERDVGLFEILLDGQPDGLIAQSVSRGYGGEAQKKRAEKPYRLLHDSSPFLFSPAPFGLRRGSTASLARWIPTRWKPRNCLFLMAFAGKAGFTYRLDAVPAGG